MLPRDLLSYSVRGDLVTPRFLGPNDVPWLRTLLDEVERLSGCREAELDERLRAPVAEGVDSRKQRLAAAILRRTLVRSRRGSVDPKKARAALFAAAAATNASRDAILGQVANELSVSPDELDDALFADLPGQRTLSVPPVAITPIELMLRANLELARGLLARACVVSVALEGNARAIVRQAKLRRLICGVRPFVTDGAILDISGPFALFRHTLLYGRALGELLPLLAWCKRFRLEATCVLGERTLRLQLASGDPIFPSTEPRRFDSKVEERFFRDFSRLGRLWDVIREPEPVQAGTWLMFPDFVLQHRHHPDRRWYVEIIGFWTDRYLDRKLASYRAANLENIILCIADDLVCSDTEFPAAARVLRYRKAIDASAVLRIIDPPSAAEESMCPVLTR